MFVFVQFFQRHYLAAHLATSLCNIFIFQCQLSFLFRLVAFDVIVIGDLFLYYTSKVYRQHLFYNKFSI
ncbi:hypothetical protein CW304_28985 [Bacillus sp. UFRGS-B20]|nr:hypothetical protein CW304_28985 [Bacillus sp. UFRGS-B20]